MNNKKYSSDFKRKGRKVDDKPQEQQKLNKAGVPIEGQRHPRRRFINGKQV